MGTLLALSLTTLQSSRAFRVKGASSLLVPFPVRMAFRPTRHQGAATVKEYSREASKSLLDVRDVFGLRDVLRF